MSILHWKAQSPFSQGWGLALPCWPWFILQFLLPHWNTLSFYTSRKFREIIEIWVIWQHFEWFCRWFANSINRFVIARAQKYQYFYTSDPKFDRPLLPYYSAVWISYKRIEILAVWQHFGFPTRSQLTQSVARSLCDNRTSCCFKLFLRLIVLFVVPSGD